MTTRPYNLTPADTRHGWPTDPARLTSAQLFEILESEEWPR